jgi:general secretion pathway protein I
MNCRPRSQSGFSLLEVIVAFAIAAVALGVLSQIFGQGASNMAVSRDYDSALLLAESLLAEHSIDIDAHETSFSATTNQFRWEVSLQPYITREPAPELTATARGNTTTESQLMQIDVVVGWEQNGKFRSVNLSSLRLLADNRDASTDRNPL